MDPQQSESVRKCIHLLKLLNDRTLNENSHIFLIGPIN